MKRLRIVQQILIVILFAVVVPFVTIGLIISNVSQQSVRRELNYGVTQISSYIADTISSFIKASDNEFGYIAAAVHEIPSRTLTKKYLNEIEKKSDKYKNLKIVRLDNFVSNKYEFNPDTKAVSLFANIEGSRYLSGELSFKGLEKLIGERANNMLQTIFIFDDEMALVAANSQDKKALEEVMRALPKNRKQDEGVLFSKIKNQPLAYFQMQEPNWVVVVMTNPSVTKNTIDRAREKIVLSLLIAAFCIFLTVGLYTYYLYINIRQLFKGIIAISKGSYDRKIRLLKSIFTPHEIVFLEKEFNYMTQKVSQTYSEISEKTLN